MAKVSDLSHLDQVSKGASRGNHRNPKSKNLHFCKYIHGRCKGEAYVSVVCVCAEGTIYPGQQSGRRGEEETGTAEAGARAGARTKTLNTFMLKSF